MKKLIYLLFLLIPALSTLNAQEFSVDAYKKFLSENKDLTSQGFFNLYPAGLYLSKVNTHSMNTYYLDSIINTLSLTEDEQRLISNNGFMVTERLSYPSFTAAMTEVYNKDLPLFISTDMILHSIHRSYDAVLKQMELKLIIPRLSALLSDYHSHMAALDAKYKDIPEMQPSLRDYDVFITIARKLLEQDEVSPYYQDNREVVDELMGMIQNESPSDVTLFAETSRTFDFSQFTVRGHYNDLAHPELGRYFKSMIWLGRTELYLIAPQSLNVHPTPEDIRRQIIDSYLLLEATESLQLWNKINEIDEIIISMVGESDNVKLIHLQEILAEGQFKDVSDFVSMENCDKFQDLLASKPYAEQKILSQILMTVPGMPDSIKPASAFLLFGQRFIIDSYVMANVVFDKVDKIPIRLFPSTYDVLFALGNNAAGDFLESELQKYHYAPNLASLRYLIDSYDSDFWSSTVYNNWLSIIRTLNAPDDDKRHRYPDFMKTSAWWQEKMNTQLASWSQLRHDNLLYAKQSYTGGVGCSFPYVYVEPIPEFYQAVQNYAALAKDLMAKYSDNAREVNQYLTGLFDIAGKLKTVAQKELSGECLTLEETTFLSTILSKNSSGVCGDPVYVGWIYDLFFVRDDADTEDYIVADVHTIPTDEYGNPTGWIMHVGTGPVNIGVFTAPDCNGNTVAYAGPVLSYYEHTSVNFKRLTDEDWEKIFLQGADISILRPDITDLYLADNKGENKHTNPATLPLGTSDEPGLSGDGLIIAALPNPFTESVILAVSIPQGVNLQDAVISVYDASGYKVAELFHGSIGSGKYTAKWDATDINGDKVQSGMYIVELKAGGRIYTSKLMLNK